ncbi:MAG TPA: DPP IV N-terminal domain-containing protein [Candidatus Sulfotelmatobacter sp.]|nr:DPP IV N-terminal domain-containing protein [Candidatus Sulfotelmatobacter sp.]
MKGRARAIAGVAIAALAAVPIAGVSHAKPKKAAPPAATSPADTSLLEQYAATNRFRLGRPSDFKITPSGDAVLFLRSAPRSFVQDLWTWDPKNASERVLASSEKILRGGEESISPEERARRERQRQSARGITSYQLSEDGARVLVPLDRHLYLVERSSGATRPLPDAAGAPVDARFSPDGRLVACVRNADLWVTDIASDNGWRLTSGGCDSVTHGLAEFVAQEEMARQEGYWWSPDSKTIAYEEARFGGVEKLYVADPSHPEREAEGTPYPRPGEANAEVKLGLIPAQGGHTTWVQWDVKRYPYLCTVKWSKNAPLTLVVMNREQTELAILRADPENGGTSTLWVEKDRAWLNLRQQVPRWLEDGSGFLWISERSGWPQLELHAPDGKLVRPLHAPDLNLRELLAVDEEAGTVWVSGGADPTQTQLFWLPLSGAGEAIRATSATGVHGATFGHTTLVYVESYEGLDGQIRYTVHRRGGELLGDVRSLAEQPRITPRLELVDAGDSLSCRAAIIRPRDFRSDRRYPVIVNVYGGPHSQMVTAQPSRYLLAQWLADRGFVVVSIDGRGTPARGRTWERAISGNLIDVPLGDQVAALKKLGAAHPEMDMSRVGIFGWSFGGYFTAMAVMRRPDVFRAGVAGAPVVDWRDYDTFYTERYLNLPQNNPRGYEASSVLTYAKQLERPLLIVHGTTDDNVHFLNSLKLTDALFKAGKPFEFLPLSGFTHMVADPLVTKQLYTRIAEFFERELAVQPDNGSASVSR